MQYKAMHHPAMQHHEGTFNGAHGFNLYYQSWHPVEPAKAVLGIVHGLGSHSGWFGCIANDLVAQGYAVYGLDLRGHGRSPGQRGYIGQWTEFREDFGNFWQLMTTQHPHVPCFTLGHSLGAVIILDYVLHYPETRPGIITMAPTLKPIGVPPIRLAIGQVLSRTLPRFTLNTGIPEKAGSRDLDIVATYTNDPLRHTKGTARLVTEYFKTTAWIQANLDRLQSPILILHGSHDFVSLPDTSRVLFEQIPVADKEYREYVGAYHDLHNDINAQQVSIDIANWLERHVNGEFGFCNLSTHHLSISA